MTPSHSSEAIVLRSRSYGESDKIVCFLTADAGKLTGIAKGAKNSRRRFANCLDPLTRVRVHFRTRAGASMVFMESCDLLAPPGELAEPTKFAYGSYLVELIDQLTADGHTVRELFELLSAGLDELRHGAATTALLRTFELRALGHAGYGPQLHQCARCHGSLSADPVFLDPLHGSLLCTRCRVVGESLVPLSARTVSTLHRLGNASLAAARDRPLNSQTATEAALLMGHLLALHLTRPLRSTRLIAALAR